MGSAATGLTLRRLTGWLTRNVHGIQSRGIHAGIHGNRELKPVIRVAAVKAQRGQWEQFRDQYAHAREGRQDPVSG